MILASMAGIKVFATGGVGGAQILFYDWDDTLIGALVVDPEGDARPLVNEYVEKTFIHPRLRTGRSWPEPRIWPTCRPSPNMPTTKTG